MHNSTGRSFHAYHSLKRSSNIVARRLRNVHRAVVSSRTVRRRLNESGLSSRRPAAGPRLLARHRKRRLEFATQHLHWNVEQWEKVLFSDESKFNLRSSDGLEHVYRRPNERYAQCCFVEITPFGGGGVMWSGEVSLYKDVQSWFL